MQAQLASGRYGKASEVLRDALRLMEDRARKLASLALDDSRAPVPHDEVEQHFASRRSAALAKTL